MRKRACVYEIRLLTGELRPGEYTLYLFADERNSGLRSTATSAFYEVDPMVCPKCGGRMEVIAFITEYAVLDRIINHLKLRFVADKPPPSHVFEQVALTAAEKSEEYF